MVHTHEPGALGAMNIAKSEYMVHLAACMLPNVFSKRFFRVVFLIDYLAFNLQDLKTTRFVKKL